MLSPVGLTFEQDGIGYVEPTEQLKSVQKGDDAVNELLSDLIQKIAETGDSSFYPARTCTAFVDICR